MFLSVFFLEGRKNFFKEVFGFVFVTHLYGVKKSSFLHLLTGLTWHFDLGILRLGFDIYQSKFNRLVGLLGGDRADSGLSLSLHEKPQGNI